MTNIRHNIRPSDTLETIEYLRLHGKLSLNQFKRMHHKHHTLYTHVQYLRGLRTNRYRKSSDNMRLHEKLRELL